VGLAVPLLVAACATWLLGRNARPAGPPPGPTRPAGPSPAAARA
jgi:hypothetical protein